MKRDEHIRKEFGKRIKQIREQKGLVQTDIAYEVEVEPGYISRLELGKSSPTLEVIIAIARVLECQPGDLLNDL